MIPVGARGWRVDGVRSRTPPVSNSGSSPQLGSGAGLQFSLEPRDQLVELGSPTRLDCEARLDAQPGGLLQELPQISWRTDDGQPISFIGDPYRSQLSNGSLYISSANDESVGGYQCFASTENVGAIVSRTATVRLASLPGFEREPQDTMVYPGQIAYLSCKLATDDRVHIQWLKDEQPIILDESRMTILPSGSLEIDEVLPLDVGSYWCNASAYGQFRVSNKAQLTLQATEMGEGESAPAFVAKPFNQVVVEGSTVTLECAANGNPKPYVYWLKDGTSIDLATLDSRYQRIGSSSLMIKNVREEDTGSYQCRAKNDLDSLDAMAELSVQVPPRFLKRPQDKEASQHQDLEFECEIYGKPAPSVHWLKNGERIKFNDYWQLANGYHLRINGLLDIDAGIFQCMGTNPAGSVQASARLTIRQPNNNEEGADLGEAVNIPAAPRNLSAGYLGSRLVALRWQEPELPASSPDVTNYLVYYKQSGFERERIERTPTSETSVTISGLQPGTAYQFRAVANISNTLSASSKLLQLTTESEPNVPSQPPNLRGWATSHQSIRLIWDEPPSVNGRILNYLVTYAEGDNDELKKNTSETSLELSGLLPYREYSVWVQAVNENGPGASSGELKIRTLGDVPSFPPNVTADTVGPTSAMIRWELPPEGHNGIITGYKIRYRPTGRRTHSSTLTTEGNQRSFLLNKLEPNVNYEVKVCAFNTNGTGPYSEWVDIEAYESDRSENQVPNAPTNLRTKAMSDSIALSWESPKDQSIKVRGYVLTWGKGIPDEDKRVLDGKTRHYTITGLEPNADYVLTLRAKNEAGEGMQVYENVRTIEKMTSEKSITLNPPVGLKAIVMSHSTVVLYWTDMQLPKNQQFVTDNRYYIVRYTSTHRTNNVRYKYYNATDLYCMIHDLKPYTEYEFTVKVVKGRRESGWSMVVLNKTTGAVPSSPPQNLAVHSIEDYPKSVLLQWDPPKQANGEINGYIIMYNTENSKYERDWKVEAIIGDKTEHVLSAELRPNTTYYFKIAARNSVGVGPYCSNISHRTRAVSDMANRGLSSTLVYIISGCSILVLTVTAILFIFICCRRNPNSPDGKKGYLKDTNIKTNIKPPDLWIHHDQMELKALEKNLGNGDTSTSATTSNTLPRSGNSEYNQDSIHGNSSSLDKRTYIPSYMGIEEKCSTLSRQHSRGSHKPKLITLPVDSAPLHQ
ncbi:hypothetical protein QAD02_017211, partial [Eretmocerus hayati]